MTDSPTHYRSLTTGEVLTTDQLDDCERCDTTGEVPLRRRDSYTGRELLDRWVTCGQCWGSGVLEGFGIRGDNYAPRRVVAIEEVGCG